MMHSFPRPQRNCWEVRMCLSVLHALSCTYILWDQHNYIVLGQHVRRKHRMMSCCVHTLSDTTSTW